MLRRIRLDETWSTTTMDSVRFADGSVELTGSMSPIERSILGVTHKVSGCTGGDKYESDLTRQQLAEAAEKLRTCTDKIAEAFYANPNA